MNPIYDESQVIALLQDPSTVKRGFEMIVRQYSEQMYWQIRRMVFDHDDANDVLQNAFLKAWSNIENFRGEAKISTWLYRITFNECLTFINNKKAECAVCIDDLEDSEVKSLSSDSYFEGTEAQRLLQEAIKTLPEKQRIVFNLKYFDDLKYDEMSDILGVTVGALKASYFHAVQKIQKFIQDSL